MNTSIDHLFIQPDWPAPRTVHAYTSLKQSQVGMHQQTHPEGKPLVGNIDRNRLQALLQLPSEPIWLKQVHSTISLQAIPEHLGKEADASFSYTPHQICAVLTADCLPILLCDKNSTFVAAIHAGWRGLANGIIESTLKQATVPTTDLFAWLGPAIGPQKFEVKEDVYQAFLQKDPDAAQAFHKINHEQWLGDLYTIARQRLMKQGVTAIYGGEYCTYSDAEHFYSYRREKPENGRKGSIISLIWLSSSPSE